MFLNTGVFKFHNQIYYNHIEEIPMTIHNPKPLATKAYNHMRLKKPYKTSINFCNNCSFVEQLLNEKRRVVNWKGNIQD